MSNHIHLLVEDVRGCLSQAMSLTQSVYARYFNDSRGERGAGHLFGDRFFCEVVSSARYYDRLASYILLNPLRCATPLAALAEDYPWSSAALHCDSLSPAVYFARLLERHGGADTLLAALPTPSTQRVAQNRRARVDALLSGAWISSNAVRCGRSPYQMRDTLRRRAGMLRPEPPPGSDTDDGMVRANRPTSRDGLPHAAVVFAGIPLAAAVAPVQDECASGVLDELADIQVLPYLLWRFCSASARQISMALGRTVDEVVRAVISVRRLRTTMAAWAATLWRLEWRLRWRLASGPYRA
jgi:hypothetical protein